MMSNLEKLVHMANQIAANLTAQRVADPVKATADHITAFWDPRMRRQIVALLDGGESDLDETAAAAVALLKDRVRQPS
jgi:formate dehydrogenase subunit delta